MASLSDAFNQALESRAAARAPSGVGAAMDRYGWSTRDLAQQLGVSERTARRYRQQDRIPDRRPEQRDRFTRATRDAARARRRGDLERRGLKSMRVHGTYKISKSSYRTRPDLPVRFGGGDGRVIGDQRITAAEMRDYFAALDAGDQAEAERILGDALEHAYGAEGLRFEDVESLDYGL